MTDLYRGTDYGATGVKVEGVETGTASGLRVKVSSGTAKGVEEELNSV